MYVCVHVRPCACTCVRVCLCSCMCVWELCLRACACACACACVNEDSMDASIYLAYRQAKHVGLCRKVAFFAVIKLVLCYKYLRHFVGGGGEGQDLLGNKRDMCIERIFFSGKKYVFVGHAEILQGHCPMSQLYFKACHYLYTKQPTFLFSLTTDS